MATGLPSPRPGLRSSMMKIPLVLFAASWFLSPVSMSYLSLKPDIEYVYTLQSSTDLKKVRTLQAESKMGFVLVKSWNSTVNDRQLQIYLRVHSAVIIAGEDHVSLSEEKDFSAWFSFDVSNNGSIDRVYYPRDEDEFVVGAKKGMVSLLAGSIQPPPSNQVRQSAWSYNSNETGQEGYHQASYTAQRAQGPSGIIVFTKKRLSHPIPYGETKHQKEIHYHPGLQIATKIKIMDQFEAPREAPKGFKQKAGKFAEDDIVFPEMQTFSEAQLTFVHEEYYPSPTGQPGHEDIIADSLQIKVPDLHLNLDKTELKALVSGNLTCMRTAPLKGSHESSRCFQELVRTLRSVPDDQQLAEVVASKYKLPLSRRSRDREDRLNLLDALTGLHTESSQSLLTDLILLSPRPNKQLVERLLIASVGFSYAISERYLETVEDIVFYPGKFPESLRDREIHKIAVMVLGALAGNLWETGHKSKAEMIVAKIEDKLEVHDPWAYDKTLKSLSNDEQDDFHHGTVAWIEALGNAGLPRSFPHIQSYMNSSATHLLLKRAGLHSMRNYHHDTAAGALLRSALDKDEDETVRYEASLLYKAHPHGGLANVSKFISSDDDYSATLSLDEASGGVASVPSRHRVRRGFWDGIQLKLASPSKSWRKRTGSSLTGAEYGLTFKNELDLSIAPLSGHLRVELLDEAYATVLVGLVGETVDVALARFCFTGNIEYNLNILQEFGVERVSDFAKAYDLIINQVVGNIRRAVDIVVSLFNGELRLAQLFDNFVQTLENIPARISDVRLVIANAVARLARFDPDQLPRSIKGVLAVVHRATQLFGDIKTDVMEFYQAVSEAITITLPWAAEQIWQSIVAIADSIVDLLSSPLKAISDIFKGVLNIKVAVDSILVAKKEIEEANFFKEGQRPYWFDLPTVIGDMLRELQEHLGNLRRDLASWVDEVKSSSDPVKKLTGGAVDSYTLRRRVQEEIESIFQDLMTPMQPIQDLLVPFFDLYHLVFDSIKAVKEAYQALKNGYQKSQALVMKLFGPKAHEEFPRKFRDPGSGWCASGGFYPTDSAGYYQDQGIDLKVPQGASLVAPFSGVISRSDKPKQVILQAGGGAFLDIKILIDNVEPIDDLSESNGVHVIAGATIGKVGRSSACLPANYIHLSMKKTKSDRLTSFLDGAFGGDDDRPVTESYVDPSDYLSKRPLEIPQWTSVCDDYKLLWLGKTVKEGSLLGRNNQGGVVEDTSPDRNPPPDTSTERPDEAYRPPARPSSLDDAISPDNQQQTQEMLGLPIPRLGSGPPFENFTLRNLKIGSILAFARKLGLDDTAEGLLKVVKTVVQLVSDKPCLLPESLTNDALRIELQQRGLSAQGDRRALLQRYRQPDDRCPLIQVTLPRNVYCQIDPTCLGVECCMHLQLFMVSLAVKAYMRYDPCQFQFVLGLNSWNYTTHILDADFGKEVDVSVPFDIPFVDDMELHLRFIIDKSITQLLVSMSVAVCPQTGSADCLTSIHILTDTVIPLPICNPDGTFTWPDIDLEEYFSRAALKKLIEDTGEELLQTGTEVALNYVLEELGIPKEFLSDKEPCLTPLTLSNSRLTAVLEERQLSIMGTRQEQELRLSQDDRTCQYLTLPVFPPEVAEIASCSLGPNCLRLDCCLQLRLPEFHFSQSFRASVEVDACDFMLIVAFQHLRYKTLLLSYSWGESKQQRIGAITLSYSIDKLDTQEFVIDFGASVCPEVDDCIFDIDIVRDYRVPIPFCNASFAFSLPGGDTLEEFVTQVGKNASAQAVDILLEYIGLKDKISDRPCDSAILVDSDEEVCTDVTLPSLPSTVTCVLSDHCLGIHCCVQLDLEITLLSVKTWLVLDPCEFTLSIGLDKWSSKFTIFDYHWGTQEKIGIGKALTVIYTIDKLADDKVFVLDLSLSLCLPEMACDAPSIDILKGTRVPIPLCNEDTNFTLPGDGTVQGFLEMVGPNAGESTVDAILRYLDLSDYISQTTCDRPQVTQNGWHRVCPRDVALPRLPGYLVCTLPETCLGFSCCLELPIPGMAPVSTRFALVFDPCTYQLSLILGSWSQDLKILSSYQWGQQEQVTIGKPFTISLTIDKLEVEESFQINLDISFCLDGDCTVTPVLRDALVPIPLCDIDASFQLPGDGSFVGLAVNLAGDVSELPVKAGPRKREIQQYVTVNQQYDEALAPSANIGRAADDVVVNRLGVSADVLLPQPCHGTPVQITPTTTGCSALSLPSSVAPYCSLDATCLGVGCCLTLDLGTVQRPFSIWAKLDPCASTFSVGFEKWSHTESLSIQTLQAHSQERDIGALKLRYDVERPHSTVYDVDLDISLCWKGRCEEAVIILQDAMFTSWAHCEDSATNNSSRRKQRSADYRASDVEGDVGSVDDLAASSVDKARDFFKALLNETGNVTLSAEDNILTRLQPDKVVKPRVAESGTASRRSMGPLVFGDDEDASPVARRWRRDVSRSAASGGESWWEFGLSPGADSDTWQGDTVIGGGLTQKGLDALGQRISNMTIGELEAMLDLQNMDPTTIVQLMKDLRSLFRTFMEEFIDVVTNGEARDNFQQFDVILRGTISFPRRSVVFFRERWGTLVGGFIYLEFKIEAGGFFDMEIPVSVGLVSMTVKAGITPMVGAYARASVSIGLVLYGEMEMTADVLHTSFPSVAEIRFSKFPLDVGLKVDVDMIPLVIRLRGLVTLKVPFFGRKTLYKKDLWRHDAHSIHSNILDFHTKFPDESPPVILEYSTPVNSTVSSRQRVAGRNLCGVEQVPGLDYTEPAFQLEVSAADDKSLVTYSYQVGTVPGGSDVLTRTQFGGPSAIISQILLGGHPLYFTVYATNNGGGTATATCSLPTFDITLPTGRVTPDFITTSHPHLLRASAVVYDDSVILLLKEAVGFGREIWGDQIVQWNTVDITERQHQGTSANDFDYFTAAKKGRLISKPTRTFVQPNANSCARDCLALPETKCLSINYNYEDFTCELLEEIEGHGVQLHQSGLFTHYERLGVGHAVQFDHASLQLAHNNLYYFNLELLNYLAYQNIISAVGILVDYTPPAPGLISNGTRDEVVHEACMEFTPEEWERRCIEDTPLDNHRYIVDGPGSMSVFNGYEELVDTLYTRSNTFMAANWDGFHDNETGIHGYTWSIGNSICHDNVSMHVDPHAHLFDESEWTHQGLVVDLSLPDGAYFVTVRALNKVEFGGPLALSVCHSTPLIIDNTPPIIYSIRDVTYNSTRGRIGLRVNAMDPESNLLEYHLAAGRTPRDISLHDWEAHTMTDQLFMDFKIPDSIPCWVKVRAVNNVGLQTVAHADRPILVDDTPPIAGDLFDGPHPGRDLLFTKDRNEICANWRDWYDAQSGISSYLWAVGTQPGGHDVLDFVKVSNQEHSACTSDVTLQHNATYYSTLIAFHGGYDRLNVSASSNGVTVDLTPPVEGTVLDGNLPGPTELDFSSRPATVEAQWQGFLDQDSGIDDFQVSVYRKHDNRENSTSDFEILQEAESVGSDASSIEWHHFHLHHKDRVYVNLRTINRALNHIDTPTNGFLVDLTPPMLRALGDGLVVGQDADYQSNSDSLAVHWDYVDEESGLESFELAIYEMRQGIKHKIFPLENSFHKIADITATSHMQDGLSLRTGSLYIVRVKARNQAKLVASHETSGVKVDPSPPVMKYVRGGNLDGEQEEILNGYVYQNSRTTIQASWLAVDGQSGIKNYWVAVGTAPHSQDIRPFTSLGSKGASVLSDLNLRLTNESTCSDDAFTTECWPVYYVCVKSENGAGDISDVICSSPIRIVEEDQPGFVTDGPDMLQDSDAQLDTTTVTIWFDDFQSQLHGISRYEWAVGTTPGGEDVQPLTSDGIVPANDPDVQGLAGRGKAQASLPLQHGVTYYSTLRAITNADNILESTSNGFRVDVTPPELTLTKLGQYDAASIDLSLEGGIRLYQANADSLDASWESSEGESDVLTTSFSLGTYPGSGDIFPETQTNKSYMPPSLISPAEKGLPNILAVQATNSVGLSRTVYSTSVTVDHTPPTAGQVRCPDFTHAAGVLLCHWSGFLDDESGVDHFRFLVGTAQGLADAFQSVELPGHLTHYSVKDLSLVHNMVYYVTVEAFNAINQSTMAFSDPIQIDDTPPSPGLVVELPGVHSYNVSDPEPSGDLACWDHEQCLSLDSECLESVSQLRVLWQPFTDEDTRITRYEVALGTAPGGSQIRPFYRVPGDQTWTVIVDVDLSSIRRVYATVRGYNEAGLASTAVSNGIYVSRFSAGLQPLRPFLVKDGVTDNTRDDRDFQTSWNELSASWDFSGDPCPIKSYKWAIYRVDGREIQPLTDVGERTSDTNTDVEMTDGETYYAVVQAVNALGLTITVRSDGVTVRREPLIPGQVYDGLLAGFDLTSQRRTDTISASWSGFGQGTSSKDIVQHSGNAEVAKDHATEQAVDFYEAAVGTDRRYPKTRDNVVPFTYLAGNITVTFTGLNLEGLASTYYVTVRAHSASFSMAEVTSTGITVGINSTVLATALEVPKFVDSLGAVSLTWDGFESSLPILLYHVGLGRPTPSSLPPGGLDCLDMLLGTEQAQVTFNERPMHFVGKDTYVELTGLSLTQNASYYVTVAALNEGGQCNSSTSYFSVDVTPPVEGQLRSGPFYDMPMSYTDSAQAVVAVWKDYSDDESGIQSFRLRLVEAASCDPRDDGNLTPVPNQDWLDLGPDVTNFTFVNLTLVTNQPYFVQFEAVNRAGVSTLSQVGPILVDTSEPTAGLVVDGDDFTMDQTDSGERHRISGTILHLPNPDGPPCALRDIAFTDISLWSALDFKGLWNMEKEDWSLMYQPSQVSTADESVTLKLERDTRGSLMLSGAYVTNAQIVRSSEYQFDLLAASPDLHAVTSVLFWDGPDGTIGEFEFDGVEDWQGGICQCCYVQPLNQSECPCDCADFLGLSSTARADSMLKSTTDKSAVSLEADESADEERARTEGAGLTDEGVSVTDATTPRPWTIGEGNQDGDAVSDEGSGRWVSQRACGLQLYPNGRASQAILWCRYAEDEWPMMSQAVALGFDPSLEEHRYGVHFQVTPFDAQEDLWSFEVFIDGQLLSSLTGTPILSTSTKLIIHVFNRDSLVADLQDPFNPPSVTATIRNLRMSPDQRELCRYGAPFRAGTSPVSRYFAGIGSEAGATDIVAFEEFARPCVPCLNPCDRYQCDPSCGLNAAPITFTLNDLSLPRLDPATVTRNGTGNTTKPPTEDGSAPFFLTVKSVLGNGKWAMSSSNGFYVDDTPPELDVFFYVDINVNEFEPTWYQSSHSTISVLWSFLDTESMVKAHYWAIGTSRGATDLQDFVNVGLNQTASSRNLTGLLHHNTTYYVTLRAVNGAGLVTLVECDGVTVLLEGPTADDVSTTSMFSQTFEEEVYPPDAEKSEDPTKTGTSWSKPQDDSVTRYEYCVSSSSDHLDDIVPCMVVGVNSSGSVAIEGGLVVIRAGHQEERYNLTDFQAPLEPEQDEVVTGQPARFNMEPGKCLHTWMRMCNSAMLCVTIPAGTSTVLGRDDVMMTSANGADLTLTSPTNQRRRRRATEDVFDITVATQGGLHHGGSLALGLLDEGRIEEEFTSDASPEYISYITNPLYTIQYTSRLLRQRIRFVYEPTFYVTSLGQIELQGPLTISASLNTPGTWTEAKPRLIYWNTDKSEWQDVAKTCSDTDRITYGNDGNQVSVEVCSTREPDSSSVGVGRQRGRTAGVALFSRETQFALAIVQDAIPNSPPAITNAIPEMVMEEDEGTLAYSFLATDAEDDILVFELASDDGASQGTATITEDGHFKYTPCEDCHGTVTFQITVREVQSAGEIKPLSTTIDISIKVRPVNDNPVLYIAQHGQAVGNGRVALLTVEQNTGTNVAYTDLVAMLGAYDVDTEDNLTITYQLPTYGKLTMTQESKSVPLRQSCSAPSVDTEVPTLPCGLELPHDVDNMAWTMTVFAYVPTPGYHGRDSFLVLAGDSSGEVSQLLEVQIAVLANPCINEATCQGPADDPDCTSPARSSGFDAYSCACQPGWVGEVCEVDYDECQSTPCDYPHVCYDHLDGYECSCPSSDPTCDGLNWRTEVIIGVTCSVVCLVIIAGVIACYFYKKHRGKRLVYPQTDRDDDDHQPVIDDTQQGSFPLQAVDNPTFIDVHAGDCSDVVNQTSKPGSSSSPRPSSALSNSSSRSSTTGKVSRPLSGLRRSNAVADAFPLLTRAASNDEENPESLSQGSSRALSKTSSPDDDQKLAWMATQSSGSLKDDADEPHETSPGPCHTDDSPTVTDEQPPCPDSSTIPPQSSEVIKSDAAADDIQNCQFQMKNHLSQNKETEIPGSVNESSDGCFLDVDKTETEM